MEPDLAILVHDQARLWSGPRIAQLRKRVFSDSIIREPRPSRQCRHASPARCPRPRSSGASTRRCRRRSCCRLGSRNTGAFRARPAGHPLRAPPAEIDRASADAPTVNFKDIAVVFEREFAPQDSIRSIIVFLHNIKIRIAAFWRRVQLSTEELPDIHQV